MKLQELEGSVAVPNGARGAVETQAALLARPDGHRAAGGMSFRSPAMGAPRVFATPQADALIRGIGGGNAARPYLGMSRAQRAQQFAQPDWSDVHIDVAMTQISIQYRNTMWIGGSVFPRVQVQNRSNKYFVFDKAPFFRDEAGFRELSAPATRGGYTFASAGSYACEEVSFETPIDDRVRANADAVLSPDRNGTQFVSDKIDLSVERRVASIVTTSSNWTSTAALSGTDQWSDYANSDPFDKMKTARTTIFGLTGREPNTLVLGYQVFQTLCLHPDLLDRCKYTGTGDRPAMVTASMIASLFMVDQVLIGGALYDTSNEGASSSLSYVWAKNAWLGYVAPTPSIEIPSAGYVFTMGRYIDRYREDRITSDVIRGREDFDAKVTAADSGYLFTTAIA